MNDEKDNKKSRTNPTVFTEEGDAMRSSILKTDIALQNKCKK